MRFSATAAALVFGFCGVACGGTVFNTGGGGGSGGVSAAGSGGAGSTGVGGSGTGGTSCALVDCAVPACPAGVPVETPPGACCPVCDCNQVACAPLECPAGVGTVIPPGQCCPVCDTNVAPSCAGVVCIATPSVCPPGYQPGRPPGACCVGCVPTGETIVPPDCSTVDCAMPVDCPLGYHVETYSSQCCPQCVPDPGFCNADSDCLIANDLSQCCSCGKPISVRTYADDACWSAATTPRTVPKSCMASTCTAACIECPPPGTALCSAHHCTQVP